MRVPAFPGLEFPTRVRRRPAEKRQVQRLAELPYSPQFLANPNGRTGTGLGDAGINNKEER